MIFNVVTLSSFGVDQILYKSLLSYFVGNKANFELLPISEKNATKLEDKLANIHKYLLFKLRSISDWANQDIDWDS